MSGYVPHTFRHVVRLLGITTEHKQNEFYNMLTDLDPMSLAGGISMGGGFAYLALGVSGVTLSTVTLAFLAGLILGTAAMQVATPHIEREIKELCRLLGLF